MRFKHLGAAISLASVAVPLVFAGQAQAASSIETLIAGTNHGLCVSDNNVHPGTFGGPTPTLALVGCNGSNGNDTFYATASSYGAGWFSIVSNDHNATTAAYCIIGLKSDGKALQLVGCDGDNLQAWRRVCVSGGTELENAAGESMNDYGGSGHNDDTVASWHFENPAPASLIFTESAHDMGTC